MTKVSKLEKLAEQIVSDNICSELADGATQLVMGSGNTNADIVFIGEAPGKKEDETGQPFVGVSGRFLDEMLAAANMQRDDIYITNIVKYRPPKNRDPTTDEKQSFWPYLEQQLEVIRPKVIITLGRHSGQAFIKDLVISRDHGKSYEVNLAGGQWTVIPLYHPAAALYNGSMRQVLVDDFVAASAAARAA